MGWWKWALCQVLSCFVIFAHVCKAGMNLLLSRNTHIQRWITLLCVSSTTFSTLSWRSSFHPFIKRRWDCSFHSTAQSIVHAYDAITTSISFPWSATIDIGFGTIIHRRQHYKFFPARVVSLWMTSLPQHGHVLRRILPYFISYRMWTSTSSWVRILLRLVPNVWHALWILVVPLLSRCRMVLVRHRLRCRFGYRRLPSANSQR